MMVRLNDVFLFHYKEADGKYNSPVATSKEFETVMK
jgi:hypothetical protein